MKFRATHCRVQPTEVDLTAGTNCYSPCVAGKPRPFRRFLADVGAAGSRTKTTNMKDDAMGIGKAVLMATLDLDAFRPRCNQVAAHCAQDTSSTIRLK